jgi:hypothetical protein
MSLKIFPVDPNASEAPRQRFGDDVVGRFRSGYVVDERPVSLSEFRVTTGDPEVADKIYEMLGGDAPQEWGAKGEDNLEIFTASSEISIIIESEKSLRQRLTLWSRAGKLIYSTDGETKDDGTPDPDAGLSLAERKQKGKDGIGPSPDIEIYFRLADDPDLGIFKFQSGSWSLASDLAHFDVEGQLADAISDSDGRGARATLKLEPVSFVAKNGEMKGKTVSYTKPVLRIKGPVAA